MHVFFLLHNAQRHSLNPCDVIKRPFGNKNGGIAYHQISMKIHLQKKSVLSCKHLKRTPTYEVLAKELETINWVFGIKNKNVNTTADKCSNFVKAFNVYGETAETVEEESSDKERSSSSGGNVDEDTIQTTTATHS